jgi:multimeric flavodoxin WrbA
MAKGYTEKVLRPFLEGMENAGAQVSKFYSKKLKIKPCTGTFYCWYQKPGQCIIKDDMDTIYPEMKGSNILVLGMPVYFPFPGEMQNFLNRLMPLIEPMLVYNNGRTRAKFRDDVMIGKIVLVSAGGWWEKGNFDILLRFSKTFARDANVEFSGAILRPHALIIDENPDKAASIYDACKKAGTKLIQNGKISRNLLDVISQPLLSEEQLRERYNKLYERVALEA